MELLTAMRDLGVATPTAEDAADERIRATLVREIERVGAQRPTRSASTRRKAIRLLYSRWRAALLTGVATLAAGTAVAAAAGVAPWTLLSSGSASKLFSTNPSQVWSQNGMSPIASSVTELGTISVPGVGTFQYWGAQTQNGEWCMAFRGPDGVWAGTQTQAAGKDDPSYNFTGDVPGCGAYSNNPLGGGFHWSTDEIGPNVAGNGTATVNDLSAVIFGAIDNPGAATHVIDAATGASAPILDGHYFALVEPRSSLGIVLLQAVNGAGNVTAQADPSPAS